MNLPSSSIRGQLLSFLRNIRHTNVGEQLLDENVSESAYNEYDNSINKSSVFYLYLMEKYKSKCVISNVGIQFNVSDFKQNELQFDYYVNKIKTCINHNVGDMPKVTPPNVGDMPKVTPPNVGDILIIPLILVNYPGSATTHANMLVYRAFNRTLEHFEPYSAENNEGISDYLKRLTNVIGISYVPSNQICLYGPQYFEMKVPKSNNEKFGYCLMWSTLYAELCLKNPTMTGREIINEVMNMGDKTTNKNMLLRNIMRGYVIRYQNTLAKYFSGILAEFDTPGRNAIMRFSKYTKNVYGALFNSLIDVEIKLLVGTTREQIEKETREQFEYELSHEDEIVEKANTLSSCRETEECRDTGNKLWRMAYAKLVLKILDKHPLKEISPASFGSQSQTKRKRSPSPPVVVPPKKTKWKKHISNKYGVPYWHDAETGKSVWEEPEEEKQSGGRKKTRRRHLHLRRREG